MNRLARTNRGLGLSSDQGGAALFLSMAILSLMALLVLSIYLFATQVILLLQGDSHSALAKAIAIDQALKPARYNYQGLRCHDFQSRRGKQTLKRSVCVSANAVAPERLKNRAIISRADSDLSSGYFPAFNYNHLFATPFKCRRFRSIQAPRTLAGIELSSASSYSGRSCTAAPAQQGAVLKVAGNLDIERLVLNKVQAGDSANPFLTVAVVGYLAVTEELISPADTIIVAAGDILINNLTAATDQEVQITLLSASGSIKVNQAAPKVALRAIAAASVSVPELGQRKISQLWPTLLGHETFGLYLAD